MIAKYNLLTENANKRENNANTKLERLSSNDEIPEIFTNSPENKINLLKSEFKPKVVDELPLLKRKFLKILFSSLLKNFLLTVVQNCIIFPSELLLSDFCFFNLLLCYKLVFCIRKHFFMFVFFLYLSPKISSEIQQAKYTRIYRQNR